MHRFTVSHWPVELWLLLHVCMCVFLGASSCMTSQWKCVPPDTRTPWSNAWIICLSLAQIKTCYHLSPFILKLFSLQPFLSAASLSLFFFLPLWLHLLGGIPTLNVHPLGKQRWCKLVTIADGERLCKWTNKERQVAQSRHKHVQKCLKPPAQMTFTVIRSYSRWLNFNVMQFSLCGTFQCWYLPYLVLMENFGQAAVSVRFSFLRSSLKTKKEAPKTSSLHYRDCVHNSTFLTAVLA